MLHITGNLIPYDMIRKSVTMNKHTINIIKMIDILQFSFFNMLNETLSCIHFKFASRNKSEPSKSVNY